MQLQPELGEARPEFLQTRLSLVLVLEADHEIVRVAHDDHISAAAVLPPPSYPQIEDIMKIHVRQER